MKLGKKGLYDYFSKFGLTEATGVDYPGEARGWLPTPDLWSDSSIANIPFGQGVSATPLQLCRAIAAIANGGELVTPHFLLDVPQDSAPIASGPRSARSRQKTAALTTSDDGEGRHGRDRHGGCSARLHRRGQDGHGAGRSAQRPRLREWHLHRVVHRLSACRRPADSHLRQARSAEKRDLRRHRRGAGLREARAVLGFAPQDSANDAWSVPTRRSAERVGTAAAKTGSATATRSAETTKR